MPHMLIRSGNRVMRKGERVQMKQTIFQPRLPDRLKQILAMKETAVFFIILVISVILSLATPYFLTSTNLLTTVIGFSNDGIVAIGLTLVLVLGGIDLSIGAIIGFSCMVAANCFQIGLNIWVASMIAVIAGTMCGVANGFFISKVGLSPFITTLAMQGIVKGTTMLVTQGQSIPISKIPSFEFLGSGKIVGIPVNVWLFIVLAIISDILLRYSGDLRKIYCIGSNEKASRLSGINVEKIRKRVYIFSAFLASIVGILMLARFKVSTPTTGTGAEMRAVSAAVIGGASLSGGQGSILGAVLGIIMLNILNNGLVLLNVSVYGQDLISGVILLLAVTLDHISHKKAVHK